MNLTDPLLWPAELAAIRFVSTSGPDVVEETQILSDDGAELGVIARLGEGAIPLSVGDTDPVAIPTEGCWQVSVFDGEGGVLEDRVLFGRPAGRAETMPDDVARWAVLTVLWARCAGLPCPQG